MATIDSAVLFLDPETNNQVNVIVQCQITIPQSESLSQFYSFTLLLRAKWQARWGGRLESSTSCVTRS
jgi:hypothetical protein